MRRIFILLATTGTLLGVGIGLLNPVFVTRWQANSRVVFAGALSDNEIAGLKTLVTERAALDAMSPRDKAIIASTVDIDAGGQALVVSYNTPDREASVRLANNAAEFGAAKHNMLVKAELLENRLNLEVAADELEAEAAMVAQLPPSLPAFTQHFTKAMAGQATALREVSATQNHTATNLPETKAELADIDSLKRTPSDFFQPALHGGLVGLAWAMSLGALIALFSRRKRSEFLFASWVAIGSLAGAVAGLFATNFMPNLHVSTAVFQPLVQADFPKQNWLGLVRSRGFTKHVVKHAQLEKAWKMSAEEATVKLEQQREISLEASENEWPILRAKVYDVSMNDSAMIANAYSAVLLAKLGFIHDELSRVQFEQQRSEEAHRNHLASLASVDEATLQSIAVAEAAKSRLVIEQAVMPPVMRVLASGRPDSDIAKPDKPAYILLWMLGGLAVGALAGLLHASRPPRAKPPEQEIGEAPETPLAYARG